MPLNWACVVHLYYGHLTEELLSVARQFDGDLFITVPSGAEAVPPSLPGRVLHIPNRGLDVGPFLVVLADYLLDGPYDCVLKLHSKRDDQWRRALIQSAVEGREVIENDAKVGLVGSRRYLTNDDCRNVTLLRKYHQQLFGEFRADRPFIAGTIFAARLEPFRRFFTPGIVDEIYAEMGEGYERDGTVAHALERILGHVVAAAGYQLRGL